MKSEVIRARVPEELKRKFEAAIVSKGWKLSHAIRQLMTEYVNQEEERLRRHEETLEAIEDIESGRVVSGTKVMNWLSTWGSEDEKNPPK